MGFLSRKPKPAPVVVEEEHPIVDELRRMEEAVPEMPRSAGPVPGDDSSSSQAAGEEPSPAPPAEEASAAAEERAPATPVIEAEPEGPARMKAADLLGPNRLDLGEEKAEPEAPVGHPEVIAFANQKGGVAKTTTTLNLAVAFAESGYRVLCVDLDPQGNLTMSQGLNPDTIERSMFDVLVHRMPIEQVIEHREIDIAVSSIDLAGAELALSSQIGRERALEKALALVKDRYDFILIDTPPSLGLLTINAFVAATGVIVPV